MEQAAESWASLYWYSISLSGVRVAVSHLTHVQRANPCIVELLKSSRPVSHKLLWSVLVFIFPIGGIVIYWLLSDRQKWNNGNGYEAIQEEVR